MITGEATTTTWLSRRLRSDFFPDGAIANKFG